MYHGAIYFFGKRVQYRYINAHLFHMYASTSLSIHQTTFTNVLNRLALLATSRDNITISLMALKHTIDHRYKRTVTKAIADARRVLLFCVGDRRKRVSVDERWCIMQ